MRSHLGRPIDPAHPSNVYAVVVTVAAAVVIGGGALIAGSEDWATLAFRAAAAAFLGWALGRELDPDDTLSAGIAAPLAAAGVLVGAPDLASTAGALMALRVVIRPTGHRPTVVDEVVLVALGAFLGWRIGTWPALLGLAIAIAWDGLLPRPSGRRTYAISLLVIVAGMLTALGLGEPDWEWIAPMALEWVVLAAGLLAALVAYDTGHPSSVGDLTGEPLNRQRLHMGRLLGVGVALAAFGWLGGPGITGAIPIWAGFAGVALASAGRKS